MRGCLHCEGWLYSASSPPRRLKVLTEQNPRSVSLFSAIVAGVKRKTWHVVVRHIDLWANEVMYAPTLPAERRAISGSREQSVSSVCKRAEVLLARLCVCVGVCARLLRFAPAYASTSTPVTLSACVCVCVCVNTLGPIHWAFCGEEWLEGMSHPAQTTPTNHLALSLALSLSLPLAHSHVERTWGAWCFRLTHIFTLN